MSTFFRSAVICVSQQLKQARHAHQFTRTLTCMTMMTADPQKQVTTPQFPSPPQMLMSHRTYAKGKGKAKKEKKGAKLAKMELSEEEIDGMIDLTALRSDMQQIIDSLKTEFIHSLALSVSTGLFDRLMVTTEDGKVPMNQIAQIIQKSGNLVLISLPKTPQYTKNVVDAIINSGVQVNPQQEGTHTVFVNIPKVSRERREQLAKSAKTLCTRGKNRLQDVHNKYQKLIKQANQEKTRSISLVDTLHKTVTDILHEYTFTSEKMMKAKQEELLGDKKS